MNGPSGYGGRWKAQFATLYTFAAHSNALVLAATEGADRFEARQFAPRDVAIAHMVAYGSDGRCISWVIHDMNAPVRREVSAAITEWFGIQRSRADLQAHLAPDLARKTRELESREEARRAQNRKNARTRAIPTKPELVAEGLRLCEARPNWKLTAVVKHLRKTNKKAAAVGERTLWGWIDKARTPAHLPKKRGKKRARHAIR